jgi:hypothetical protein
MKLNPFAIMAEQFDGTGLIFDPNTNAAVSINKTGVYLWSRVKEGATEEEMVSGMLERYSGVTKEQAATDVKAFLQELRNRSLISEE